MGESQAPERQQGEGRGVDQPKRKGERDPFWTTWPLRWISHSAHLVARSATPLLPDVTGRKLERLKGRRRREVELVDLEVSVECRLNLVPITSAIAAQPEN